MSETIHNAKSRRKKLFELEGKLSSLTLHYLDNHKGQTNYEQQRAKEDIELITNTIQIIKS